jgi:dihydrofolate synthase/folylpolyglutamate synthase
VRLIYGAMRDKAIDEIGGILFPHAQQVIVTAPRQARALDPESIRQVAEHRDLRTAANLGEALGMLKNDATAEDVIFITGSLFLVAEAREMLVE